MHYKTIKSTVISELTEKKSKFICILNPVANSREAEIILADMRRQYPGARHYCFAYILKEQGTVEKYSDDGEPGNTAGVPMLNILRQNDLQNIMAVVVRYFGGTLLGTGGLVRAYSGAVKNTLDLAEIVTMEYSERLRITIDYSYYNLLQNKCWSLFNKIVDTVFADQIIIDGWLPSEKADKFKNMLDDITARTAVVECLDQDFIPGS